MQAILKYLFLVTILLVQLPSRSWGLTGTGIRANSACNYSLRSRHNVFSEKRKGSELPVSASVSDSDEDFSISAKRVAVPRAVSFLLARHFSPGLPGADLLPSLSRFLLPSRTAQGFISLRRFLL